MIDPNTSILIIGGGGTFGASTAYHLAKRGYTNITSIDRHPYPSIDSAGYDLNKIIRTEYDEPLYAEMAIEAIQAWREPMYKDVFHETGWIVTTCGEPEATRHLRQSYENLVSKNGAEGIEFVETPEDIIRYVPQLKDAKDLSRWKGLWNKQAGWAHAANALKLVASEAEKLGVRFVSGPRGTMKSLDVQNGRVVGVNVASGDVLRASKYILATGAASPGLMPELSPQLWSKCWTAAHIEVTEEELAEFKGMPIVDNHELGFFFEPDLETRLIKICNATQGYQSVTGEYGGRQYSIPWYLSDHAEEGIPAEALRDMQKLVDNLLPRFSDRPLLYARYCWCTDTPDQHFLIAPHPTYGEDFMLATGDSGHGFKFLPIIGGYIADCLEGKPRGRKDVWRPRTMDFKRDPTRPGDEVKDIRHIEKAHPTAQAML